MLRVIIFTSLLFCGGQLLADDLQDARRLYKAGEFTQALQRVNNFLTKNPKDAQARFLKAMTLSELKQNAEAIAVYTSITNDFPELPEPYNNLAVLYAAQSQYEKAKSLLETAIHNNPDYFTAYDNLGDVYAKLANLAYDKAIQLDKTNLAVAAKAAAVKRLLSNNPQ